MTGSFFAQRPQPSRGATRPRQRALTWGALASATLVGLVACGGGGGEGAGTAPAAPTAAPPAASQRLTALYLTDDVSADHDAVWISVSRLTAVTPAGEVELAAFAPAKLINVPTLRRTGELIALAAVPSDATAVRLHVGATARLQALDGSERDVALAAPGGVIDVRLEGWASGSGALALDFDLPKFTLQGNTLTPLVRTAGSSDYSTWDERRAEVKGTVTAVGAGSVTVTSPAFGQRVFSIDAQTTFVSRRGSAWAPQVGDRVEVNAAVAGQGADGLQLTARRIEDESDAGAAGSFKVKGVVTAVNGTNVSVRVRGSEHLGATGTTVFDLAGASFSRGSASVVVPGVVVEAYLSPVGSGWKAALVEVEGAAKAGASSSPGSVGLSYAELKGRVDSVSGSVVTVTTTHTERYPALARGARVTVDLSGAYFQKGALSCVDAGDAIELKGALASNGSFQPVKVELEGGCSVAAPVAGVGVPAGNGTPPVGAVFLEAKGTVSAVRPGEFDLAVHQIEYSGLTLATVTVRHGPTTVFKSLLPGQLASGQFVEVKGSYQAGVITASKVERD